MFRKKKSESNVRITITIDSETKREVERIAKKTGQSFSSVASYMLDTEVELEKFRKRGGTVTLAYNGRTKQLPSFIDDGFFLDDH